MLLTETCNALRQDVVAPRHQTRWDEARARRPALAAYPDVAAMLAATARLSSESDHARDGLVRALISEHQAAADPFWAAVLVAAFSPMLSRLAMAVFSDTWPAEDREQLVLQHFLQAIREYGVGGRDRRACLALRMKTRRGVIRRLRADYHDQEVVLDPRDVARLQEQQAARNPVDQVEEAALAVARLAANLPASDALRRHFVRDPLRRRVREQHPDASPPERERLYQREKRRRTRAMDRVRAEVRQILGSPLVRTRSTKGNP